MENHIPLKNIFVTRVSINKNETMRIYTGFI